MTREYNFLQKRRGLQERFQGPTQANNVVNESEGLHREEMTSAHDSKRSSQRRGAHVQDHRKNHLVTLK